MSQNIYSQAGKVSYGIKTYTVDAETDKANLPTNDKMGTKCYVIESQKWYILDSNGEYVPFVGEGGFGNGSPFVLKGSVATVANLPDTDNKNGDLYIVTEDSSEYVWIDGDPTGHWEQLGVNILPETIVAVTEQMNNTQKKQILDNISGEPKKLIVTITQSGNTYSANKTFEEIEGAFSSDKTVVVVYDGQEYALGQLAIAMGATFYVYNEIGNRSIDCFTVSYDGSNDTWTFEQFMLEPNVVQYSSSFSTLTITPKDNTIYKCGELTSLTISNPPATGAYSVVFTSGATATTTTIPSTILGLESFAAEANTLYEINVLDNRAVVGSWAVSV